MGIRVEIVPRIGARAGTLAQHVERIKKLATRAGAPERLFNRLTEHKMRTKQTHGLACRRPHSRQSKALNQGIDDAFRSLSGMYDLDRETERPGRGRNQERRRT